MAYLILLNWNLKLMGSPQSLTFSFTIKMAYFRVLEIDFSCIFLCFPHPHSLSPHEVGGRDRLFRQFKASCSNPSFFFLPFVFPHTLFPPAFFQFLILVKMNNTTCFPKLMLYIHSIKYPQLQFYILKEVHLNSLVCSCCVLVCTACYRPSDL